MFICQCYHNISVYQSWQVEPSCHTTIFRFRFRKLFLSWPQQFVPKCKSANDDVMYCQRPSSIKYIINIKYQLVSSSGITIHTERHTLLNLQTAWSPASILVTISVGLGGWKGRESHWTFGSPVSIASQCVICTALYCFANIARDSYLWRLNWVLPPRNAEATIRHRPPDSDDWGNWFDTKLIKENSCFHTVAWWPNKPWSSFMRMEIPQTGWI